MIREYENITSVSMTKLEQELSAGWSIGKYPTIKLNEKIPWEMTSDI
jgi:hypothetical protein